MGLGKLLYLSEPFSISQTRLLVSTSKVGTKGGKPCEQVAQNPAHKQGSPLHPFLFLALSKPLATQEMCSSMTQRPLLGAIQVQALMRGYQAPWRPGTPTKAPSLLTLTLKYSAGALSATPLWGPEDLTPTLPSRFPCPRGLISEL